MVRSDTKALVARRQALEIELEQARREEGARRSHSLKVLDGLTVPTPCRQPWWRMAIDARDPRVRSCKRCRNHVYDLTGFDAAEIEGLIESRGQDLCVRCHRRPDGRIVTADCPDPVADGERARTRVLRVCLLIVAGLAALAGFHRRPYTTWGVPTFDRSSLAQDPPLSPGDAGIDP